MRGPHRVIKPTLTQTHLALHVLEAMPEPVEAGGDVKVKLAPPARHVHQLLQPGAAQTLRQDTQKHTSPGQVTQEG